MLKFGPEVEYDKLMTLYEESLKLKSLRGNGTYPKLTVLVYLWVKFTPGKHKIFQKTKIFPKAISLGLSNDTSPKFHINDTMLI